MDYTSLIRNAGDKKSRVGIIGATKGYGYTLLAQIPKVKLMELRLISSRHTDECEKVLLELGWPKEKLAVCATKEEIQAAPKDAVLIVSDYRLVPESDITALVECTGNSKVSSEVSMAALRKGINVYMCSKALVNGDQPRNLVDLWSWGKLLGFEIIAVGKASEYDFVWTPDTGEMVFTEGPDYPHENIPELKAFWNYKDRSTLEGRRKLLEKYISVISADLCEMNLVSNITGLVPAAKRLSYPVAKTSELADIFIPEEDGGVLKKTGVVDVFCCLRANDEASFGGGEFIIVKCENEAVWDLLAGKGHVVSRNKKYACLYLPYHIMGVETPASIILGDFLGIGTHPECRQVSVMAGVASRDLPAGTVLEVKGHHHSIDGLVPELWEKAEAAEIAPFYLLSGLTLKRDIKKGEPVTKDAVDLGDGVYVDLYEKGFAL